MSSLLRVIYCFGLMIAAIALISSPSVRAQTSGYIVTDVSADDATQVPCRLNNFGDLVGRGSRRAIAAQTQATLWTRSSLTKKHLGAFSGGDYSSGTGINDIGEVTGASNTGTEMVPFLWTATSGLKRVPLLPGDKCGQASSINRYGHVVGYSSGRSGVRAFFWVRNGNVRQLATLPGGDYSKGRDLNDRDEVVGTSGSSAGQRAVLWANTGTVIDLGTLPGDYASEAVAINNRSDVVGYSKGAGGMRAFLWNKAAGMQALGVLPGRDSSRALGINDLGEVVGSSAGASGDHAFIWTKEEGMVDLNNASSIALDVVLFEAHAINNKGQIIAMGESNREISVDAVSGASVHEDCAPAPPGTFLLTPIGPQ